MSVTPQVMSITMKESHYLDDVISDITRRKANVSCVGRSGLLTVLERLGFRHKAGKNENHRIFTHKELSSKSEFKTFSVDCGHGMKKTVKPNYSLTVLNVLKKYHDELREIYDES